MPEIFATRCGSIESSKQASMIEAVIEVMPAARAQGRDLALVVAVGVAELVLGQAGMMEFWLGEIGHVVGRFRWRQPWQAARFYTKSGAI